MAQGGEASVALSSDTSCGDWNPRQQREALKPPGAGPDPRLLPMKDHLGTPSRPPPCSCHHCTPGTWFATSRVCVLSKPHRDRQNCSSRTPLHYSPPPQGTARLSSNQGFDAHGDPTHPAAFVQRKDKQSGMCQEQQAKVEEHWPRAGESWIPGSALCCTVVNSGQSLPTSGSFFLIQKWCDLFRTTIL